MSLPPTSLIIRDAQFWSQCHFMITIPVIQSSLRGKKCTTTHIWQIFIGKKITLKNSGQLNRCSNEMDFDGWVRGEMVCIYCTIDKGLRENTMTRKMALWEGNIFSSWIKKKKCMAPESNFQRCELRFSHPVLKDFSKAGPHLLFPCTHALTPTVYSCAGERPLIVHLSGSEFACIEQACCGVPPFTNASKCLITLFSSGSSSLTLTLLPVMASKT